MNLPAEKTYNGRSLPRHAARIKGLIDQHRARTLLDYGSGKGHQYRSDEVRLPDGRVFGSIPAYWGVDSVTCYDPAYRALQPVARRLLRRRDLHRRAGALPRAGHRLDSRGVVLASLARFVFANVACYPAMKHLPNGENAHCTVRGGPWWQDQLRAVCAAHPGIRYEFLLDELVDQPDGRRTVQQQCLSS